MPTEPVEPVESTEPTRTELSPPTGRTELTAERIATSWHATEVALAPDGARVAWAASPYGRDGEHPEGAVWVAIVGTAPGAGAPRRWSRGGSEGRPAWSPDGSRLAFLSDRAERGTAGLYVLDPAGGEAEPVAVRRRSVGPFAWSPDSARLAFLAPDDPGPDDERRDRERDDADVAGERLVCQRLFTVPSAGGLATAHTDAAAHLTALAWRPDGDAVAVLAQPTPELDAGLDTVLRCVDVVAAAEAIPATAVSDHGGDDPMTPHPTPAAPPDASTTVCAVPWAAAVRWTADGSELVLLAPHERLPSPRPRSGGSDRWRGRVRWCSVRPSTSSAAPSGSPSPGRWRARVRERGCSSPSRPAWAPAWRSGRRARRPRCSGRRRRSWPESMSSTPRPARCSP